MLFSNFCRWRAGCKNERGKINKLLDEQKLGQTGAVDPNTAAKVGKILGLNAIVTGAVTQFGVKKEGKDFLITQSKKQTVEATVDVRVVDTETGQVLLADSGKGVVKKSTGKFLGMGNKSKYDETLEGEALRAAIVKLVENIISQVNMRPWSYSIKSSISEKTGLAGRIKNAALSAVNAISSFFLSWSVPIRCFAFHIGAD